MGGNFGPGPTVEEVAVHLFISVARLRQLQREDVLPRRNSSDWSLEGCRRRYIENLRAVKGNHLRSASKPKGDGAEVLDLNQERAKLAKEQTQKTAMENGRLRGELLPADEVSRSVTGAFARVRARMLSLPTKAAPRAVGKESLAEVQALLAGYVEEALAELAETVVGEDVEGPESQAGEDRPGLVAGPPAAA